MPQAARVRVLSPRTVRFSGLLEAFGAAVNLYSEDKPLDTMLEYTIRNRAYDLYLQRGSKNGRALEDWLDAEQEVLRDCQSPSTWASILVVKAIIRD
jgi:Protein of unknown function (DUF2934)